MPTTKERILDAAETLFGDAGFSGTSLRELTASAGVNLAAVHYHFGSKQALLAAVLERRVAPVNRERLEWLDVIEARGTAALTVESILEAFLVPAIGLEGMRPIVGRLHSEPLELVRPIIEQQFGELARRFTVALERVLPEIGPDELRARFDYVIGTMIHVVSGMAEVNRAVLGSEPCSDEETIARMVAFLSAGLRAPVATARKGAAASEARP